MRLYIPDRTNIPGLPLERVLLLLVGVKELTGHHRLSMGIILVTIHMRPRQGMEMLRWVMEAPRSFCCPMNSLARTRYLRQGKVRESCHHPLLLHGAV
jgi:hypothetical protein